MKRKVKRRAFIKKYGRQRSWLSVPRKVRLVRFRKAAGRGIYSSNRYK